VMVISAGLALFSALSAGAMIDGKSSGSAKS
jgi:hypothetical protein